MSFIIAMLAGLFIIISGYNLFLVEFIIAISLLLIGVFIISGKKVNFSFISSSLLVVGLFHGWAFGETIVGQENAAISHGATLGAPAASSHAVTLATVGTETSINNICFEIPDLFR